MQEAKNRANDIVMTAQKTAAIQSEEMLKEASSQVTAMKEKAEKDIAQEKRKAVNEIKGEIGGMAVEIAGKVIEREISEEDGADDRSQTDFQGKSGIFEIAGRTGDS